MARKPNTSTPAATPPVRAPYEPVLDADQIQGHIFPGFNKPIMTLLFLRFEAADAQHVRDWLKWVAPKLATMLEVLAFRRKFRAARREIASRLSARQFATVRRADLKPKDLTSIWINMCVSHPAIAKLIPEDANLFADGAFRAGLPARSSFLGDPTDPKAEGHPGHWIIGGPGNEPDFMLIVAGDEQVEEQIKQVVREQKEAAEQHGLRVIHVEEGRSRRDHPGHEHFGFDDGVSQPGLRGRDVQDRASFLTAREISPSALPQSLLYGRPGEDLIWPGEFIFGYPGEGPDPLIPGPIELPGPAWMLNGSYVVFRRYRQDVALFYQFIKDKTKELAKQPGFKDITDERLAALLVGRWQSGAPLSRTDKEMPGLGRDDRANNYFGYAEDFPPLPLKSGYADAYPIAHSDPLGMVCPQAAHIRKVNTRDAANDDGGHMAAYRRRILRRGIAFGEPLPDPLSSQPDPLNGNRGLLFICYQASIERQFEFLRHAWMGSDLAPRHPGGDDIFIGLNGRPGEKRIRRCVLFGQQGQVGNLSTEGYDDWIIPTGGAYFFAPSVDAILQVLAQ